MNYRNRSVRCRHGFARDLVRCPECDPPAPRGKNKYYVPSEASIAKLMLGRQPRGPAWKHQAKGYTYGRDVGGGRQR